MGMKQGEELNESNKRRISQAPLNINKSLPNPAFPPLTERAEAERATRIHVEPDANSDVCHTLRTGLREKKNS